MTSTDLITHLEQEGHPEKALTLLKKITTSTNLFLRIIGIRLGASSRNFASMGLRVDHINSLFSWILYAQEQSAI